MPKIVGYSGWRSLKEPEARKPLKLSGRCQASFTTQRQLPPSVLTIGPPFCLGTVRSNVGTLTFMLFISALRVMTTASKSVQLAMSVTVLSGTGER